MLKRTWIITLLALTACGVKGLPLPPLPETPQKSDVRAKASPSPQASVYPAVEEDNE